uniref:Lectizyme n=1 Tax=Glossina brevipalpis TaxID=37001 RepID=A0A1A9W1D3_9MUSC
MLLNRKFSIRSLFITILATGLIGWLRVDEIYADRKICHSNKEPSVCVPYPQCVRNRAAIYFPQDECEPDADNVTQICCLESHVAVPVKTVEIGGTLLDRMCAKYYRPTGAVTHGEKVAEQEFPFMFALGWKSKDENDTTIKYKCGCSLIAARYVLTAAHCLFDNDGLPSLVRVGGVNLDDLWVRNVDIAEHITHPDYDYPSSYNDIALIKLATPLYSFLAKPACLWTSGIIYDHSDAIALGYGQTSFAGTSSQHLLKTTIKIHPQDQCKLDYPSDDLSRNLKKGITETLVCAMDPEKLRDTCSGDSGGPLLQLLSNGYEKVPSIIGITSFGVGCASGMPGIYTRVSQYLPWIEKIIWPDEIEKLFSRLVHKLNIKIVMDFKQIFLIKFIFNIILAKSLIESSNENNGSIHVCRISGEPSLCVPRAMCKRDKNVIHFYDDKCESDPNGTLQICCLISNLLIRVLREEDMTTVETPKKSLAEQKCDEYYQPKKSITFGQKVLTREFPFMYALGWKNKNQNDTIVYKCGASLISSRYVLTAAHCFYDNDGLPSVVRAGGISLTDPNIENIEIAECIEHPDYKYPSSYNDIALVKLTEYRAPSSKIEGAACLWTSNYIEDQSNVTALGYGQTSFGGTASEDLLKTTLKVYPQNQCEQDYPPDELSRNLKNGITKNFICAIDPENLRDTCQGDSGGPIVAIIKRIPFVVGITSFGVGCASGMPGIYTRVSEYISWIESIIWHDSY